MTGWYGPGPGGAVLGGFQVAPPSPVTETVFPPAMAWFGSAASYAIPTAPAGSAAGVQVRPPSSESVVTDPPLAIRPFADGWIISVGLDPNFPGFTAAGLEVAAGLGLAVGRGDGVGVAGLSGAATPPSLAESDDGLDATATPTPMTTDSIRTPIAVARVEGIPLILNSLVPSLSAQRSASSGAGLASARWSPGAAWRGSLERC